MNVHGGSLLEVVNEVNFFRAWLTWLERAEACLEGTAAGYCILQRYLIIYVLLFFGNSPLSYTLWLMLIEALCWKLLTRSTFVCGSSHANGPTTLENTVTRSSSFRTRFRPFTPRQPSSNKVIRHCYTLL